MNEVVVVVIDLIFTDVQIWKYMGVEHCSYL